MEAHSHQDDIKNTLQHSHASHVWCIGDIVDGWVHPTFNEPESQQTQRCTGVCTGFTRDTLVVVTPHNGTQLLSKKTAQYVQMHELDTEEMKAFVTITRQKYAWIRLKKQETEAAKEQQQTPSAYAHRLVPVQCTPHMIVLCSLEFFSRNRYVQAEARVTYRSHTFTAIPCSHPFVSYQLRPSDAQIVLQEELEAQTQHQGVMDAISHMDTINKESKQRNSA